MASLGEAVLRTSLDTSGLRNGLQRAEADTKRTFGVIDSQLVGIGQRMTSIGRNLSMRVTAPIVGFGAAIIGVSANFEKSMNRVRALTNATGDDFTKLQNQAKLLGETTVYSASQAADAMGFLAMAGLSVDEIYGAMPSTLQLAASAQLDLGDAADIVTNILTGFGMGVDDLEHSVDVLAAAFTSSNTDLRQLGEGMKYVGPVASSFGFTLEETTAAVGMLSNAGLQASVAGTGLRRIMSTLAREADTLGISIRTSTGEMRPFADILADVEARGMDTAEAMDVFGDRGGPAMMALLGQGSEALREFTGNLEDAGGTAERIANIQLEGLLGKWTELKSAGEGLLISWGENGVMGLAEKMVVRLTDLVRWIDGWSDSTKNIVTVTAGLVAGIGPLLIGLGSLTKLLPVIATGLKVLSGPTGWFMLAAGGAIALNNAMNAGKETREQAARSFDRMIGSLQEYRGELHFTNEAERAAAQDSLNRQKRVLEVTLENAKVIRNALEAEVAAYGQAGLISQIFGYGAQNARAEAAAQLRAEVATLEAELAAVNVQLEAVSSAPVGPKADTDGLDAVTRAAGATEAAIVGAKDSASVFEAVTVRNAGTAEELFNAIAATGTRIDQDVQRLGDTTELRLAGIEQKASLFRTALERAWDLEDITSEQFDYMSGRLEELETSALNISLMLQGAELQLSFERDGFAALEQARRDKLAADYQPFTPRTGGMDFGFRAAEVAAGVELGLRAPGTAMRELEGIASDLEDQLRDLLKAGQYNSDEYRETTRQLTAVRNSLREVNQALEEMDETTRISDWQRWRNRRGDGGLSQVQPARPDFAYQPFVPRGGGMDYAFRARELTAGLGLGLRKPVAVLQEMESTSADLTSQLRDLVEAGGYGTDRFFELQQQIDAVERAADAARRALGPFSEAMQDVAAFDESPGLYQPAGGLPLAFGKQLRDDLADVDLRARLFGESLQLAEERVRLHEVAILDAARKYGENSHQVQRLTAGYEQSLQALQGFKAGLEAARETLDLYKDLRGGVINRDGLQLAADMGMAMVGPDGVTDDVVKEFEENASNAGDDISNAGVDLANSVIAAGNDFLSIVQSARQGDAGGVLSGIGGLAGGIMGAIGGALGPWGPVVSAGMSLLGGLFSLGGDGNREREEEARRNEARQSRSAPAITVTAIMNQTNQFNTGITDPVTQHALDQQIQRVVTATLESIGLDAIMQKGQVAAA